MMLNQTPAFYRNSRGELLFINPFRKVSDKLWHTFQGNEIRKITVIIKKKRINTGWLSLVYHCESWHCRVEMTTQSVCLPNQHENLSSNSHSRHNKLCMLLGIWIPHKAVRLRSRSLEAQWPASLDFVIKFLMYERPWLKQKVANT